MPPLPPPPTRALRAAPRPPTPPATDLNLPPLVRQLVALGLAVPGPEEGKGDRQANGSPPTRSGPSLAERLAPWLAWTDAIALAGALDASPPATAAPAQAAASRQQALAERDRVRQDLADAIERDQPAGLAADDLPADATPGRRYRAHQQAMDARIAPLRAQARRALAAQSPALGRIAVLDRLLEQALAARERQLLSALPAWLDRRLQRDPVPPTDLTRPLLHAELAHRLQPVDGLLAALDGARAAP